MNRKQFIERPYSKSMENGGFIRDHEYHRTAVITNLGKSFEAYINIRKADVKSYNQALANPRFEWEIPMLTIGAFKNYIQHTMEDNLTKAYMNLLIMWNIYCKDTDIDDADLLDESLDYVHPGHQNPSQQLFGSSIYGIIRMLTTEVGIDEVEIKHVLLATIYHIERLCNKLSIDLEWFMEQKLRYNEILEDLDDVE